MHHLFSCMQAICTINVTNTHTHTSRSCLLTHILLPFYCGAVEYILQQILKFIARIELRLKTTMLLSFFFFLIYLSSRPGCKSHPLSVSSIHSLRESYAKTHEIHLVVFLIFFYFIFVFITHTIMPIKCGKQFSMELNNKDGTNSFNL